MSAGARIREARLIAGLGQVELADAMSISRAAVSQWETDQTLPDVNKLVALSTLLRCSIDWLLRGDGPAPRHTSDDLAARVRRLEFWAWGSTPPDNLPALATFEAR